MPLTTDSTPIEEAATNGPKPHSLAKGTWKLIPNSDTPPMITRHPHISGSMPVRIASAGVYCRVAGGFFASRAAARRSCAPRRSGSTSCGHQFFGGSANSRPQAPTTISMYSPIRSSTSEKSRAVNR